MLLHGNCRGFFYMPYSCEMGPTALLPLWRKADWGFFHPKNPTASAGFEPANLHTRDQHANHQITEATFSTAQTHISLWIQFLLGTISCWCNGVQLINISCWTWRNAYNITPQKLYVIREGVNFGIIRHTAATDAATRKFTYNVSSTWSKDVINKFSVIKEMLYAFLWVIHQCP
jgi:hypothetical protein